MLAKQFRKREYPHVMQAWGAPTYGKITLFHNIFRGILEFIMSQTPIITNAFN